MSSARSPWLPRKRRSRKPAASDPTTCPFTTGVGTSWKLSGARSFPYIAVWSREPKTLKAAMTRIQVISSKMISRIESSASREGASVNTWLVQALQRAVEPRRPSSSGRNRLTGYGRS